MLYFSDIKSKDIGHPINIEYFGLLIYLLCQEYASGESLTIPNLVQFNFHFQPRGSRNYRLVVYVDLESIQMQGLIEESRNGHRPVGASIVGREWGRGKWTYRH